MKRTLGLAVLAVSLFAIPALAAVDNAAPVITITWPHEGLTIATDRADVQAAYEASEDAAIQQVSLVLDGRTVALHSIDPPEQSGAVSFVWVAAEYADGSHDITVRAVDTAGEVAEQTISVLLTRRPVEINRGVRILSPEPGTTVAGRTPIEVVPDRPASVRYVIFLIDDVFKAMTNMQPFTYVWDTTRYLNGLHELQVKAYLGSGGEALSPPVQVRVDNPSGPTSMREAAAGSRERPRSTTARDWPPARAKQPTVPPPMRTQSLTPAATTITMADPQVGAPGTAPFVSATGELMHPPSPLRAEQKGRVQPVEIATLPAGAEEAAPSEMASSGPPAEPTVIPAEGEMPAVSCLDAMGAQARVPEAAPIAVALLPALPVEEQAPVAPAARSVAVGSQRPAAATSAPAVEASSPTPAAAQIAMLPPRPIERIPTPKVTAAPAPAEVVHVVRVGDWLWAIASEYGVSPKAIARANGLSDANMIHPGQRLMIPAAPVYFDNRPLATEVPTTIAEGRAMVEFRPVIEESGGSVVWESAEKRASAVARGHEVAVTIGSDRAEVDGGWTAMGAPAELRTNRAVVPLRFLGDALDLVLQYEDGIIHIASW